MNRRLPTGKAKQSLFRERQPQSSVRLRLSQVGNASHFVPATGRMVKEGRFTAPDIETVRQRAKDALKHHESGSGHVMQFKPTEAANVAAAVAKLQEVGVPLLVAVADYVLARKALPMKWTVADAARGFADFKAREEAEVAGPKPIKFSEAVAKFHERNEKRGLSEGYKSDCKKHLKIIGKTFDGAIIQTLKQPELTVCIEKSTKGGARRFNNLRCTLNALFGFCQKEGILPRDRTHEDRLHKGWAKMVDQDGELLVEKRANAFRHSYGIYRFAILKDEYKTSAEMGNSPNELRAI